MTAVSRRLFFAVCAALALVSVVAVPLLVPPDHPGSQIKSAGPRAPFPPGFAPLAVAYFLFGFGYIITAFAPSLSAFAILSGLTIGLGSSASFAPIVADVSLWFDRNRGLAMSFAAGGSYVSGVFWPPVLEHFISSVGWRQTHIGVCIF